MSQIVTNGRGWIPAPPGVCVGTRRSSGNSRSALGGSWGFQVCRSHEIRRAAGHVRDQDARYISVQYIDSAAQLFITRPVQYPVQVLLVLAHVY